MRERKEAGSGRTSRVFGIVAAALLAGSILAPLAIADDQPERDEEYHRDFLFGVPTDPSEEWALAVGGRIYDKWWEVLEVDEPEGTHPAYPADAKKSGASTWRCKECHGWDYKGAAGAYGKGSHYTGIKGVSDVAGEDPAKIAAAVRGEPHGFTPAMIPDEALARLALFLSKGQHDTDDYIDGETKKIKGGEMNRGRALFQAVCAACHGFDGKSLNFGSEEKPEYLGTIAAGNPWEALHKIRNGQPVIPMPLLRALPMQDSIDILTYAQTLPTK